MSKINKLNHLETRGRSKLSADYDQAPKKVPKLSNFTRKSQISSLWQDAKLSSISSIGSTVYV